MKRYDDAHNSIDDGTRNLEGYGVLFPHGILSSLLRKKVAIRDGIRATLFAAPAGYGKTLTLRQLRATTRHCSSIWLDLDEPDREPQFFLRRLASSLKLRTSGSKAGGEIGSGDIASIAATLNDHAPITIFLDRCEALVSSPSEECLRRLIDLTCDNVAFAIAGRSLPKINIGALKARGVAEEVGANRLRLTNAESMTLLEAMPHLLLDKKQKRAVIDAAEGWAAGLGLIASCIHSDRNVIADTSCSIAQWFTIGEYFEEVLTNEPEDIQNFLMKISLLEDLSIDLCDEVIGAEGTYGTLKYCYDKGLFLFPDDVGHWSKQAPPDASSHSIWSNPGDRACLGAGWARRSFCRIGPFDPRDDHDDRDLEPGDFA